MTDRPVILPAFTSALALTAALARARQRALKRTTTPADGPPTLTGDYRPGWATPGVRHYQYVFPQGNGQAYGHHVLEPDRNMVPGAWLCGLCDRWVIRGMGRWWEDGA